MSVMLTVIKDELLNDYKERLRNAELNRARIDGEIDLLNDLIESLSKREAAGEMVSSNRLKGQEGHG